MSNNPFGGFDFNTILKNMQGNPVTDTTESNPFFKSVTDAFFKPNQPKDLGELWDMQKQALASLADGNSDMSAKMTKVANQQIEVFQEAYKTYQHYANKAAKGETVDKGAMQTAQNAMLKAMSNMQELGAKNVKMSSDAATDLQKKMTDSVGELSSLLSKFGGK